MDYMLFKAHFSEMLLFFKWHDFQGDFFEI